MFKATQVIAALTIGCAALLAGCASKPEIMPPEVVPVPTVESETAPTADATILERFQEVSREHEAEKHRADALEAQRAEQKSAREKAEAEGADLRQQVAALEKKANQSEELRAQLDQAQQASLEMENNLRQLRRELLEERLTGAKREQELLALKIERAMERRKQALTQMPSQTSVAAAKPQSEETNEAPKP